MARPLRLNLPDARYHVTARGNQRQDIFHDDHDREHFLELLGEIVARYDWQLQAYVLMPNHYHLLVQTPQANLSQAMHWLGVSYTVWFNRRHARAGHLFQGRYSALLVEEAALLEVSRYVHLNPVRLARLGLDKAARQRQRAGAQEAPDPAQVDDRLQRLRQYRWSSYRAYVGFEKASAGLSCDAILRRGDTARDAAKRYQDYVESALREGLPESPWDRVTGGLVLGSDEFVRRIHEAVKGNRREQPAVRRLEGRPTFADAVRTVEALKGETWEAFRDRHDDWGRDLALWLARRRCGLTLRALGEHVGGLDYVTVSMAIKRLAQRLTRERSLAQIAATAEAQMFNAKI